MRGTIERIEKPKISFQNQISSIFGSVLPLLGLYGIIYLSYFRLFNDRGFWDNDWLRFSPDALKYYSSFPMWNTNFELGSSEAPVFSRILIENLHNWLVQLGLNDALANRMVNFWPLLVVAPFSSYIYLNYIFRSKVIAFVGALLFTVNTEWIIRISLGHIILLYGIAFVPLIFYGLERGLNSGRWFWLVLAGFLLALTATYDLRTNYMLVLILVSYLVTRFLTDTTGFKTRLRLYFKAAICLLVIPVLLSVYFILPTFTSSSLQVPVTNDDPDLVKVFSFSTMSNTLTSANPHWPVFADFLILGPVRALFWLLPALAVLGLLCQRYNRYLIYFAALYLAGAFLAKGANPPFEGVYTWLFMNVPGFNAFRESSKWYLLVNLGLSVLVGAGFKNLMDLALRLVKKASYRGGLASFIASMGLGIFFLLMRPAFLQQTEGTFSNYSLPAWQQQLEKEQQNSKFYRAMWLPFYEPISPFSSQHPEISAISNQRPLVDLRDVYSDDLGWSYLKQPVSLQLLGLMGVKYIYLADRDYYNQTFSYGDYLSTKYQDKEQNLARPILENQLGLTPTRIGNSHTLAYEIPNQKERYFPTGSGLAVWGQDNFYQLLDGYKGFDLSSTCIAAMDENLTFALNPDKVQLLNQVQFEDVMLRFIPINHLLEPFKAVPKFSREPVTWNKLNLLLLGPKSWILTGQQGLENRDFDFGKGFVWSNTPGSLKLKANLDKTGKYGVWMRSLESYQRGETEIEVNGQKLTFKSEPVTDPVFLWHKVGELDLPAGSQEVKLTAKSGYNAVNLIALLSPEEEQAAHAKAQEFLAQSKVSQVTEFKLENFTRKSLSEFSGVLKLNAYKSGPHYLAVSLPEGFETNFRLSFDQGAEKITGQVWSDETRPQTINIGTVNLSEGTNLIPFTLQGLLGDPASNLFTRMHLVVVEGTQPLDRLLSGQGTPATISYQMENPTRYLVKVENATRPFDLVFSEAYDPNWRATPQGGAAIEPEKAYSMLQSYHLDKTGSYEVVVEYLPQRMVPWGFLISGLSLILVLGLLVLCWYKQW